MKSRDSENNARNRLIGRSPFFMFSDSSYDYWFFGGGVTRELRYALGVTRELLFFGISEDV